MITKMFNVCFGFRVDAAKLNITLEADVQEHHSDTYYKVTNFRIPGHGHQHILPEIAIRKQEGLWVHTDSGKATDLSVAVGQAIDKKNNVIA